MRARTAPAAKTATSLVQLHTHLASLGLPRDAFPDAIPKGAKSYTISSKCNAASVQVLHDKAGFYTKYDADGIIPMYRSISWGSSDTVAESGAFVKKVLNWDKGARS